MSDHGGTPAGLGRTAARGVASTAATQVLRVLLQIVSVAVLARLLLPRDYGLVAMVLAFLGIGHMFRDMGLFSAAIRAPELSRAQRDNLFWVNTGIGMALTGICVTLAPVFAMGYGYEELSGIALGLAPTFVLAGAATQYRVTLARDLRFGLAATIDLLSNLAGVVVAIVAATLGAGYWALVLQQLVAGISTLAMAGWSAHWLPGRYRRHTEVRPLLTFGGTLMVSGLLTYASNNLDTILVGSRFGPGATGFYNRGVQLVRSTLTQLTGPIGAVSLPVMSKLQDDAPRLLDFARRVQMSLSYPILFAVAVVVAVPSDIVRLGLGDAWVPSAPVIAWIGIGTGMHVIGDVAGVLLVTRGESGALARLSVVTAGLTISGVVVGSFFGITEIAAGYAAAAAVVWPVSLATVARASGLSVRPLAIGGLRVMAVATAVGVGGWLAVGLLPDAIGPGESLIRLVAACSSGVLVVAASAGVVPTVRADLTDLWSMARLATRRG